jgi:hypothetical protein
MIAFVFLHICHDSARLGGSVLEREVLPDRAEARRES